MRPNTTAQVRETVCLSVGRFSRRGYAAGDRPRCGPYAPTRSPSENANFRVFFPHAANDAGRCCAGKVPVFPPPSRDADRRQARPSRQATGRLSKTTLARDCLEDILSLKTLRDLLATLPDDASLESLRQARGKRRNDYPSSSRRPSPSCGGWSCLRAPCDMCRPKRATLNCAANEPPRRLIGIESEAGVPSKWNVLRFEETLGEEPHRNPESFRAEAPDH
jgi:hypothetical protein